MILKEKEKKKKSWINQHFLCIFIFSRVFIFAKYGFRAYFACIYFREWRLKENFACSLGVLIFARTNFREFFSAYIRGYLFSRMSFYSTCAGANFREWVVSIANFLGKYVDEWRLKQERKTTGHLYFKTPFITEKTILKHIKRIPICFSHSCSSSSVSFTRIKDSIYSVYMH